MKTIITKSILPAYGFGDEVISVEMFGSGLINFTWKVQTQKGNFILQRINNDVFAEPQTIEDNIRTIAHYLHRNQPDYYLVAPLTALNGKQLIYHKNAGYFRLFPFVTGSHSKNVVDTAEQAYEAAAQFGKFTRMLSGLDASVIKVTVPFFHDLSLRYQQFLKAINNGDQNRIHESQNLIRQMLKHEDIVSEFEKIKTSGEFKVRVTHHDTKISNVLFDHQNKGICVIDLDTMMPGYFFSDIGDMMRTYLSPVSEEEEDFDKIVIREDVYKAIVDGYYMEMKDELTKKEKEYFFYAGKFMIYMQALRFLIDHLNNDIYYGAKYEGQNFVRAGNQLTLLRKLIKMEPALIHYSCSLFQL